MPVEVWCGRWPDDRSSQEFIVDLYQYLQGQPELYLVMANFHAAGSNEIDFVIVKSKGIFVIEHKHYQSPIFGSQEGIWKSVDQDGKEIEVKPAKSNPYKQLKYNYWHMKEWFEKACPEISAGIPRSEAIEPGAMRSYIVVSPDLHPDSRVNIGKGPVVIMGKQAFFLALAAYSSRGLDLTDQEIGRIPRLLKLEPWQAPEDPRTMRLSDWKPQPFAALVARGHSASVPVIKLDALAKDRITIGRDGDNDLVINDQTVSRHHACIRRELAAGKVVYVVEDLSSLSGTYVSFSGDPTKEFHLNSGVANALKNNSIVRFGSASFTFLEQKADS